MLAQGVQHDNEQAWLLIGPNGTLLPLGPRKLCKRINNQLTVPYSSALGKWIEK